MDPASLILGIAIGLVAGLALARLQRTPTLGQPSPRPTLTTEVRAARDGGPLQLHVGTARTVKREARVVVGPAGVNIEADGQTYHSLDEIPDSAMRERMRSVLADLPGTILDAPDHDRLEAELREIGVDLDQHLPAGSAWPDAAAAPPATPATPPRAPDVATTTPSADPGESDQPG